MEPNRATATANEQRAGQVGPGRRHRRTRRTRRGSTAARRRRASMNAPPSRRRNRRKRHRVRGEISSATRTRGSGSPTVRTLARLLGVESPTVLGRTVTTLGALTLVGESRRALLTSGILWVLLYTGWETGLVDAEAGIWLSAGVVLAALQALGRSPGEPSVRGRSPTPAAGRRSDERSRHRSEPEQRPVTRTGRDAPPF